MNMEMKNDKNEDNNNDDNSFILRKNTQLEVYDYSGRKLNLSICNENIKIMKYIGDVENLNIQSAKAFSEQGIDIFNAKDDFFNDIFHQYESTDGKDIIISDRREDIYINATFCQIGCTYNGINYDLMVANCICKSNIFQEDENIISEKNENIEFLNFKTSKKVFLENIFSFNYEVFRCYNLAFNSKILYKNKGFYILSLMFVLQIIFVIIYMIKKLNSLKNFMLKFDENNISKNHRKSNINIISNKEYKNNNNKKNVKNKFIVVPPQKNKIKKKSSNKFLINKINNNENKKFSDIINNKDAQNIKQNNHNDNHKKNSKKLFHTIYDLQDMDYEEAILYDKRSYMRIYWGFLVDSQIILRTFCTNNHLDLFVIKLSFLIFNFQIRFFFNALFYTDEYISDAYHYDGVLDFFSGLPKSVYSFIATLITTNLLRMLSSSKSELMKLIKEKRKYNEYIYLIKLKLNKLSKKLIIYFMIVYILSLFFLYYITAFCAVYKNSQQYWYIGCVESFAIDFLFATFICLIPGLFRYISIINRIKCFYILAYLISNFL